MLTFQQNYPSIIGYRQTKKKNPPKQNTEALNFCFTLKPQYKVKKYETKNRSKFKR